MGTDSARLMLLQQVLGNLNVGAIVLDSERRIVLWNHWMARRTGRGADSVAGCDLLAVFPELRGQRVAGSKWIAGARVHQGHARGQKAELQADSRRHERHAVGAADIHRRLQVLQPRRRANHRLSISSRVPCQPHLR